MPFFITLGALGVFAIGTVVYFWYQLRPAYPAGEREPGRAPRQPLQHAGAPRPPWRSRPRHRQRPAGDGADPGAAEQPSRTAQNPRSPATPAHPAAMHRAAPRAAARRGAAATPRAAPRARAVEVSAADRPGPSPGRGGLRRLPGGRPARRRAPTTSRRCATSRPTATRCSALAAVDVRSGRFEAAEAAYLRLLQADPRDAHAQAGLIALRSARLDPVAAESRVKTMLAADPARARAELHARQPARAAGPLGRGAAGSTSRPSPPTRTTPISPTTSRSASTTCASRASRSSTTSAPSRWPRSAARASISPLRAAARATARLTLRQRSAPMRLAESPATRRPSATSARS